MVIQLIQSESKLFAIYLGTTSRLVNSRRLEFYFDLDLPKNLFNEIKNDFTETFIL